MKVSTHFPALDELIKRRHNIVHRADMSDENPALPALIRNISREEIERWIEAVKETTKEMLAHIIEKELTARLY